MQLQNEMLAALAPSDLGKLRPYLVTIPAPRDRTLYRPGDSIEDVYFPTSAIVGVASQMIDGREVESQLVGAESGIGLAGAMSGLPATNRVFTQAAGDLIQLSATVLRRQARESARLMTIILRHIDLANSQAEQSSACNALHGAQPRLAKWLLMTQDRMKRDILPLTQECLVAMLGVQRSTVSDLAVAMKADNVIAYSRGLICIVDRVKLEALACECHDAGRARLSDVGSRRDIGDPATAPHASDRNGLAAVAQSVVARAS